jgi:predicted PhzF superfamily epimerase YddE/YHI9
MSRRGWTTVDLVWRAAPTVFYCRNPFPPGGVVEDPATGAAAAALGGYLRELGLVRPPVAINVFQGQELGRPSQLAVRVPAGRDTGIAVAGHAVPLRPHPSRPPAPAEPPTSAVSHHLLVIGVP